MVKVDYGYGDGTPDYGYGDAAPDYGYGEASPDYGYGDAPPDENAYGYGNAAPDDTNQYGYGDAAPDESSPYGYGDQAPPQRKGPAKRRCSVTKFSLKAKQQESKGEEVTAPLDYSYGADGHLDDKADARTEATSSNASTDDNFETQEHHHVKHTHRKKGIMSKLRKRLSLAF